MQNIVEIIYNNWLHIVKSKSYKKKAISKIENHKDA